MKMVFDPIVTAEPQFCVMCYKMQEAAKEILDRREDVYIRFILPRSGRCGRWNVDETWLYRHPRLEYLYVEMYTDRMKEYYRFSDEIRKIVYFGGPYWDTDLLLTCRVPLVPHYRVNLTGIRGSGYRGLRKIVVIDDMPVMSFKECVAQAVSEVQDLQHLVGYSASDLNLFINPWEREQVLQVARHYLTPTAVRSLDHKSLGAVPVRLSGVESKTGEQVARTDRMEKPFTVGFTQRFELVHRRVEDILSVMERHWIVRGGRGHVRMVCTSNTKTAVAQAKRVSKRTGIELSGIEFMRLPREEFWRTMREEVDVILVMARDDGYTLSLLEPLVRGTPAIVQRATYSVGMLGEDYPFFVSGVEEAYAVVRAMIDDYAEMYERFLRWQQEVFLPLLEDKNAMWFVNQLLEFVDRTEREMVDCVPASLKNNDVVCALEGPDEIRMLSRIEDVCDTGELKTLARGLPLESRMKETMTFLSDFNVYRRALMMHYGYEDASLEVGHLVRT